MSHAEHIVAGQCVVLALLNPTTAVHALQPLFGTPACAAEDTPSGAAVWPGSLRQDKVASSLVIKLLDHAADALNRDPMAAKECIARLCALVQADHGAVRLGRGGLAGWQVQRVTKHVDAALDSTIRARDCAKIVRLSTPHFSRSFKVSFGETFGNYVTRRRTERAQEMMIMTDQPLCEIALCCGFADQSHFTRVYRRRIGSNPGSWRRQRRSGPVTHEEPTQPA
jgi:AraC-like DNA-binding protein